MITGKRHSNFLSVPQYVDPLFFSCILLYYYSEENRRNAKDDVEGGVANGKMGVGEASEASYHRVGEEDTIGPHSEYKDKDTRWKGNFPQIKKNL